MENLARYIIRASFSQERPPWRDEMGFLTIGDMPSNKMVESST